MNIHFTTGSSNSKTGPMLVTTQSSDTCADSCPFNVKSGGNGCYAHYGPLAWHWSKVTSGQRIKNWQEFLTAVKKQQKGSLWRLSQAGDLPGYKGRIDKTKLQDIIDANKSHKGFTFTHKPLTETNKALIKHANDNGFTINLSADSLSDADKKAALGIGPVAVPIAIDPENWPKTTPEGRPIVVCLNVTKDLTCVECGLCAVAKRKSVVGFPAHGTAKRKIEEIITQ